MPDLREQLQQCFQGRVCLIGLGNVDYGDDGLGVRLAEGLKSEIRSPKAEGNPKSEDRDKEPACGYSDFGLQASTAFRISGLGFRSHVFIASTTPERLIGRVVDQGFDHVIFFDAVEFGGAPGSVVLLNSEEMVARFPQISTHKLSLGLLAKQMEANGRTKACLLGVQPESLKPGRPLSPAIQATLELLLELLSGCSRSDSQRNEPPASLARQLDNGDSLGIVTSTATTTAEVMA